MHALDLVGEGRGAQRVRVPGPLLHVAKRHLLRQLSFAFSNELLVRLPSAAWEARGTTNGHPLPNGGQIINHQSAIPT